MIKIFYTKLDLVFCLVRYPLSMFVSGALSTMPAVKSFALYAALAVLMDFALQMTAFVALLSLDARRQDNNRCELLCCIKVSKQRPKKPNKGFLMPFMKKYYAPVLLHRYTRIIVVMPHQQHKICSVHSYSKPLTSAVSLMLNLAR